jgi:hypothetical protein
LLGIKVAHSAVSLNYSDEIDQNSVTSSLMKIGPLSPGISSTSIVD